MVLAVTAALFLGATVAGAQPPVAVEAPPVDAELRALVEGPDMAAIRARGEGVLPELAALYRSGDEELRADVAAVWYGLGWKSEEAKELLLADFDTQHEQLRITAQWAAGRVSNDPEVMKALVRNLLLDPNPVFRDKAACALASDQIHLDDTQRWVFFERIIALLEAPSLETRWLAMRILEDNTGQRKGFDPGAPPAARAAAVARWRRWLEEIGEEL